MSSPCRKARASRPRVRFQGLARHAHIAVGHHPPLHLCVSSQVLRPDRCHSCLLPTRLRQENAPTSENEHLFALRCVPKATKTVAHDPSLSNVRHPSPQATHHTIPPPRATPLLPAIGVGIDNCSKNTSCDTDPTSNLYHQGQQHKQSQGASSIAAHVKTSTQARSQHFHFGLDLLKPVFQDFTRLGPICRFGPYHQFQ